MRLFTLLALLGLSGFVYIQSARIEQLQGTLAVLETQVGGVGDTALQLSGQLQDVASIASSTAASTAEFAKKGTQDEILQRAVAKVTPAVVSIVETKQTQFVVSYTDAFGKTAEIPANTSPKKVASGTGFLVRSNGYIVTNRHVVADTDVGVVYTVTLSDGSEKIATVVWRDPTEDIAILKISGTEFPTVPLGDSSMLHLGETVFAVGNVLGKYSNSVSTGIISGLNRSLKARGSDGAIESLSGVIQTDAAVNFGNSGGPLVDLEGNAVGVNVATVSDSENISFSIPISEVKSILIRLGI
ncbi:MAG: trypsin-like peptidase domain-containing protein [Minisyncoccia bacterium]